MEYSEENGSGDGTNSIGDYNCVNYHKNEEEVKKPQILETILEEQDEIIEVSSECNVYSDNADVMPFKAEHGENPSPSNVHVDGILQLDHSTTKDTNTAETELSTTQKIAMMLSRDNDWAAPNIEMSCSFHKAEVLVDRMHNILSSIKNILKTGIDQINYVREQGKTEATNSNISSARPYANANKEVNSSRPTSRKFASANNREPASKALWPNIAAGKSTNEKKPIGAMAKVHPRIGVDRPSSSLHPPKISEQRKTSTRLTSDSDHLFISIPVPFTNAEFTTAKTTKKSAIKSTQSRITDSNRKPLSPKKDSNNRPCNAGPSIYSTRKPLSPKKGLNNRPRNAGPSTDSTRKPLSPKKDSNNRPRDAGSSIYSTRKPLSPKKGLNNRPRNAGPSTSGLPAPTTIKPRATAGKTADPKAAPKTSKATTPQSAPRPTGGSKSNQKHG